MKIDMAVEEIKVGKEAHNVSIPCREAGAVIKGKSDLTTYSYSIAIVVRGQDGRLPSQGEVLEHFVELWKRDNIRGIHRFEVKG